jgi:glycosyltransferase involved in cell wall biosynthesis
MAGPGIRYHYMAEVLSKYFDVTVGFFSSDFMPEESFRSSYRKIVIDGEHFQKSFDGIDVVIALWLEENVLSYCHKKKMFIVFDVYAPVPVENLALFMFSGNPVDASTDYTYRQSYGLYKKFFEYGDLFLFSNRRQLDFWIGYVFGLGIIKVSSYIRRPLFERFIYAPMGIDTSATLTHSKKVIRNVIPGVTDKDKLLLWTGGIWNWFDAQVLIKAMKLVGKTNPEAKLIFFGIKHPNPNIPTMQEASSAISLSKELGLYNKTVFFQEGWVPYNERLNYLLEADMAVNTAKESIESEFAHRTRVLDHILTGLPTVSTAGDYISDEIITQQGVGLSVRPNDEVALADAIKQVLGSTVNHTMKQNIKKIRKEYDWNTTLYPLVEALRESLDKLDYVENKPVKELRKDRRYYKLAKKIVPRSAKKVIVKVTRYGR